MTVNTESTLALMQQVIDSLPMRVFFKDRDGVFLGANDAVVRDAGLNSLDELIGKTDFDLTWTQGQAEAFRKDDLEVMSSGKAKLNIEEPQTQADGTQHWLVTNKVPLRDASGNVVGVMGIYSDITERKNAEARLSFEANHDALTRLSNRRAAEQRLNHALTSDVAVLVVYLDLDGFKDVNDHYGHGFGDQVLVALSRRLAEHLPAGWHVSRLGGDEFLLQWQGAYQAGLKEVAKQTAADLVARIRQPMLVASRPIYLGASAGVYLARPDDDVETCLRCADLAMYQSKLSGRGAVVVYDPEAYYVADAEMALLRDIDEGLNAQEFLMYYQPQYSAAGEVLGVEALLRWQHEEAVLGPADFIAVAERAECIHKLGQLALELACRDFSQWQQDAAMNAQSKAPKFVAINVSPAQLVASHFVEQAQQIVEKYKLPFESVHLEITETVVLVDTELTIAVLHRLRELGFIIVLDDFGTGYSSLNYLATLPVNKVKLDRSFIAKIDQDARYRHIVKATVAMCQDLGMSVVCEGIETEQQLAVVKALGCDELQGFILARPMPPADVLTALATAN